MVRPCGAAVRSKCQLDRTLGGEFRCRRDQTGNEQENIIGGVAFSQHRIVTETGCKFAIAFRSYDA